MRSISRLALGIYSTKRKPYPQKSEREAHAKSWEVFIYGVVNAAFSASDYVFIHY